MDNIKEGKCPVVYHSDYNISAFGIEHFHPFDSSKWRKVVDFLKEWELVNCSSFFQPVDLTTEQLEFLHDKKYLKSLRNPIKVAQIVEVGIVACLPSCLIESKLLYPLRLQTSGSLQAAHLALKYQWSINIGGGFHHASYSQGGGFCFFADITLSIRDLLNKKLINSAIIVDLDAHQGNGHERDFANEPSVFIFDMFNPNVYPHDREARQFIDKAVYVDQDTTDTSYISKLRQTLTKVLNDKQFDLIIFNAGTDCLNGDPIGGMRLSPQCIITRDEIVFNLAKNHQIPICMLTSGGYQKNNALLIARSIENLHQKNLIHLNCE